MNQQPDKLFREKLEGFGKPAPVSAWSRVDAELNKKKDKGLWLKIAASLLVLAVAAVFLWTSRSAEQTTNRVAGNPVKTQKPVLKKEKTPEQSVTTLPEKEEQPAASVQKEITPIKKEMKKAEPVPVLKTTPQEMVAEVLIEEEEKNKVTENSIVPAEEETVVAQNITEEASGITLIYSAEEVNAKYLDKKSLAQATSGEKKPSTLRKLLDKAYDLKHNQDPLGDLRQKKNEIFALNFRSEKQRSQNK
jgi:outer membrane biosynthesis protein TonB